MLRKVVAWSLLRLANMSMGEDTIPALLDMLSKADETIEEESDQFGY